MPDPPRLLAEATAAFVDRTPIDWSALLSRVRTSPDRALFENLYALSAVRRQSHAAPGEGRASAAAWAVVGLSSAETAILLVLVAGALVGGESVADRRPQLVLALAFTLSSVPLGIATFRDPRSLFLLATFTAIASIFARSTVAGLSAAWSGPVDELLRGVWIDALVPACLWQFALGFPRVPRFARFDRFARPAVAASWIGGGVLFSLNIAASRLGIEAGPLAYVSPRHSSELFWRLFSLSLAGAATAILMRARRAPPCERRKVARLALAIGAGLGPFLVLSIARSAVPAVGHWFRTPGASGAHWVYGLVVTALAATPVMSTAAILVDRPFDRQVFLGRHRRWLGNVAFRLSCRAAQRHRPLVRALERVSRARGTREMIAVLSRELGELVGAETVRILPSQRNGSSVHWSNATACVHPDGGLAALLRQAAEPLDVSPASELAALLPRDDRDWIAAHAVHLIAPLNGRDGGMAAIVTIGPKTSGATFDRRDRWLTLALLAAAAATFEGDGGSGDSSADPARGAIGGVAFNEAALECPACGVVAALPPLPCGCARAATLAALPSWVTDKFRVQRRIGSGGMGVVYLAHDVALARDVALKTLPSLRPRAVERLREEARAMAALNHESLATLYGLEIWRGTPVLVVEYLPNGTLATRLSRGPLSCADAVALGIRLARALVYMHARAVQHRDLKPSNIAFTASGGAKLLDFGLATLSSPPDTDEEAADCRGGLTGEPLVGTRGYAPPEAFRGVPPSPTSDRWALAVVILEAASGVNPFASAHPWATRRRATRLDLTDVCPAAVRAVPELHEFLTRALAASPEHRFRTTDDLLAALEHISVPGA